jgi:hypothetical protein
MSNHAPAEVLAARLGNELYTAYILAKAEHGDCHSVNAFATLRRIERAQEILAQLREAME